MKKLKIRKDALMKLNMLFMKTKNKLLMPSKLEYFH